MLGVMSTREAQRRAGEVGLDLVEISPNADPPVCKLLDYGKFKYEQQKKKNEARKKQKVIEIKEIKVRPNIDENDYQVKLRAMKSFIGEGDKVKVTLRFRGREMAHQELGVKVLERIRIDMETDTKVEQMPKMENRQMIMVLSRAEHPFHIMLAFVTGLTAEASLLRDMGVRVVVGGGTPEGALHAAQSLVQDKRVSAVISFGLAGGLDPGLAAGDLLVPGRILDGHGAIFPCDDELAEMFGGVTVGAMIGGGQVAVTPEAKMTLYASTGASAIDLESAAVAGVALANGLKFAVLRAVADPAGRHLPPAALLALGADGRIAVGRVMQSVLRQPAQIPHLLSLAREAAAARRTLQRALQGYRSRVSATGT